MQPLRVWVTGLRLGRSEEVSVDIGWEMPELCCYVEIDK